MLTQYDKDTDRLQSLRDKLAIREGLTTKDWALYDSLEKRYDPKAYDKRKRDGKLAWYKSHAHKLTIAELEQVIAEKKAKGE